METALVHRSTLGRKVRMSFILFSESFGKTKCNARKRLWSGKGREGKGWAREKRRDTNTPIGVTHTCQLWTTGLAAHLKINAPWPATPYS